MSPDLLDGEPEADNLRRALSVAQADLRLHVAALSRMQDELAASRQEVTGARGETVQFRGFLAQAEAEIVSSHALIHGLRDEAARRENWIRDALAAAEAGTAALRAEVGAFQASFSWRITRPVRTASTVLRRLRRLLRGAPTAPTPGSAPPAAPPDPNAPYLLRPAPRLGTGPNPGSSPVTVEELHALSRPDDAP